MTVMVFAAVDELRDSSLRETVIEGAELWVPNVRQSLKADITETLEFMSHYIIFQNSIQILFGRSFAEDSQIFSSFEILFYI